MKIYAARRNTSEVDYDKQIKELRNSDKDIKKTCLDVQEILTSQFPNVSIKVSFSEKLNTYIITIKESSFKCVLTPLLEGIHQAGSSRTNGITVSGGFFSLAHSDLDRYINFLTVIKHLLNLDLASLFETGPKSSNKNNIKDLRKQKNISTLKKYTLNDSDVWIGPKDDPSSIYYRIDPNDHTKYQRIYETYKGKLRFRTYDLTDFPYDVTLDSSNMRTTPELEEDYGRIEGL
jgi:hypothetical protein